MRWDKRHGIAAAFSGFQPEFGQMISGMIADGLKALTMYDFKESEVVKENRPFL